MWNAGRVCVRATERAVRSIRNGFDHHGAAKPKNDLDEPGDPDRGDSRKGTWTVTDRDSIRYGDTTIDYEVRRSKRRKKTVEVKVSREGVRVYAPWAVHDGDLRRFVRERAVWILDHLAKLDEIEPIRFVTGETLPYEGRDIRMVFKTSDVPSPEVHFDRRCFRVAEPPGLAGERRIDLIGRALVGWYYARAAERIPATVDRWWPLLGHGPKSRILIRNQRKRWGSCGVDGTLRFNWRVMMLDPDLIDYVVVHELAHLKVRNHSADFWNVVREAIPDAQQRRKRLKEIAIGIRL